MVNNSLLSTQNNIEPVLFDLKRLKSFAKKLWIAIRSDLLF